LTKEVIDEVMRLTGSPDVAVLVRGRHLCMEARGARTAGVVASLIQSGAFESHSALSDRFMTLAHATTSVGGRDRFGISEARMPRAVVISQELGRPGRPPAESRRRR
jgi:hypothetical protein